MNEHTPTPWLREDCTVYSLNRFDANRFNCTVQPGFDEYDQRASAAECEANAALIVKAVNAHDELVAALKAVIDATRAYLPPDGIPQDELINRVLAATDNPRINAALAKAEAL